ncbi:MAG: FeoA family protein [Microcoleaceae cyanobacterium]
MSLSELKPGQIALIEQIDQTPETIGFVQRLAALGIVPDRSVQVLRIAGFGGPIHLRVGTTTEVAIRRREARLVQVRLT